MKDGYDTQSLLLLLESATGLTGLTSPGGTALPSGRPLPPGCFVKFEGGPGTVVERVGMWQEGPEISIGVWPGELKDQYTRLYSNVQVVGDLLEHVAENQWRLEPNFHIAFRLAKPAQRWYPHRNLTAARYALQWVEDLAGGHAGGRSREQLEDPRFHDWLVTRQYAHRVDLKTLIPWLQSRSPSVKYHIRPGLQLSKAWPSVAALELEQRDAFVAAIHGTVNQMLEALGQPKLGESVAQQTHSIKASTTNEKTKPCPDCYMVHAGECY